LYYIVYLPNLLLKTDVKKDYLCYVIKICPVSFIVSFFILLFLLLSLNKLGHKSP
jgi:hypothetical protein